MSGGKVYLVGAGPGEPELLTIKGLRLIEAADVIVHDRLIDARLLAMANPNATLLDVGKVPGERGRTQANISELTGPGGATRQDGGTTEGWGSVRVRTGRRGGGGAG